MPIELNFNERRVLGVLIEKGFTTPEQYPLSLNSVVVGSNQKSCRDPMAYIDEENSLDSLESLQKKGFTTCVRTVGSRVDRWKHRFGETLTLESKEVAILAELFLRGPQTDGELRQRASRMRPLETLEEVERLIESLRTRPDPLIERLGPPGRRRGVKYAHRFYPAAERPVDDGSGADSDERTEAEASSSAASITESPEVFRAPSAPSVPVPRAGPQAPAAVSTGSAELLQLKQEIEKLKERVTELEATFVKFLK
jgi:uncharacterized protein YceH (UPF0502 family)